MKGLYEAMTSEDGNMSASKLDIIEKISHGAATALRIGSTSTPMFATANLCKDILEATIMNADGRSASHIPLVAPMKIFWQGLQMLNSDNAFVNLSSATTENVLCLDNTKENLGLMVSLCPHA